MHSDRSRRVIAAGALLFLLGLVTGFVVPNFLNPRMGLASHLEGVMNGTFLIAVGAVWQRLSLSSKQETAAFWLLLYGTYANWIFVSLAAAWGTSEITPIAGAGHAGQAWQEKVITFGLSTVGIAMVVGCAILVVGFFRRSPADD